MNGHLFWLFFVHQAINGEHAATEIFNLRLQFVFNPLWIRRVADTFDEFTALCSQLLVGFFTGNFWCWQRYQIDSSVELSGHRLVNKLQMCCRSAVNVFRRDAYQVENGRAVYRQNTGLIAQDGAP
jgi:hypothetical protein